MTVLVVHSGSGPHAGWLTEAYSAESLRWLTEEACGFERCPAGRCQSEGRFDEGAAFAKGSGARRTCRVLEIFWKICEHCLQLGQVAAGARFGGLK